MNKREVGNKYETLACRYLEEKGYKILDRNYRVRQAEIDIVAGQENTLVFCEVKYRKDKGSGNPLAAVGFAKQRQISRAALFYMNQKGISPDGNSIRFDVIGILGSEITHVENAFDFVM